MEKYIIYSIDIDTKNGEEIRDLEFKDYSEAKKEFDKYTKSPSYDEVPIDNIQLVLIYNDGGFEILESKFYDN